jgi:serine/threonine protein kinase
MQIGSRLGPYEILAPLGAVGIGEVYRAKNTRLERTVAVKVLPSHLSRPGIEVTSADSIASAHKRSFARRNP